MSGDDELTALRAELEALREANAALVRVAAAAREAHAFFEGRRPGFAPSYPRDVLRAALAEAEKAAGLRPGWRRGRGGRPRARR
jgi:hypothetical protein